MDFPNFRIAIDIIEAIQFVDTKFKIRSTSLKLQTKSSNFYVYQNPSWKRTAIQLYDLKSYTVTATGALQLAETVLDQSELF